MKITNKNKLDEITQSSDIPANDSDISITQISDKNKKYIYNLIDNNRVVVLSESTFSNKFKVTGSTTTESSNPSNTIDTIANNSTKEIIDYINNITNTDDVLNPTLFNTTDPKDNPGNRVVISKKLTYFQLVSILAKLLESSVVTVLSELVDYDEVSKFIELYKDKFDLLVINDYKNNNSNNLVNLDYINKNNLNLSTIDKNLALDTPIIDLTDNTLSKYDLNKLSALSLSLGNLLLIPCIIYYDDTSYDSKLVPTDSNLIVEDTTSGDKYQVVQLTGLVKINNTTNENNTNGTTDSNIMYIVNNSKGSITEMNNKNSNYNLVPYTVGFSTEEDFIDFMKSHKVDYKKYIDDFLSILDSGNDDYDNRVIYVSTSDYHKLTGSNYNKSNNKNIINKSNKPKEYILTEVSHSGKTLYAYHDKRSLLFSDSSKDAELMTYGQAMNIINRLSEKNPDIKYYIVKKSSSVLKR